MAGRPPMIGSLTSPGGPLASPGGNFISPGMPPPTGMQQNLQMRPNMMQNNQQNNSMVQQNNNAQQMVPPGQFIDEYIFNFFSMLHCSSQS